MDNPTYSATTTVITPAQYSSLGPQDTPSTGRITNTSTEEEEVEYHEIGERGRATYETQNSDDTYNRLQNH